MSAALAVAKPPEPSGVQRAKALGPPRRWWGSSMPDVLPDGLEQLLEDACDAFGVTSADVRLPSTLPGSRAKNVTRARHVFWWVARDWLGHSFPELARMLGRDHTSVMSAVRRIEQREIPKATYTGRVALRLRGGPEADI